jgi:putative membrane protein
VWRDVKTWRSSSGERKRSLGWYIAVSLFGLLAQAVMLALLDIFLEGLAIATPGAALLFVLLLGCCNSLLIPQLLLISYRTHPLLFPPIVFFLNSILVRAVAWLVPGISISGIWNATIASLFLSMTGLAVGALFSLDDYGSYERFTVRPLQQHYGAKRSNVPGVIFVEIDGLSMAVLRKALDEGFMPTLKGWLERGSHRLTGWHTDLSSQTACTQLGILHGRNVDVPSFRWYEKETGRIFDSVNPFRVAEVQDRTSDGQGLLSVKGASRANMFSGDAPETMLTVATLSSTAGQSFEYLLFFANPYSLARALGFFLLHLGEEIWEGWMQIARDEEPRVERGGIYPVLRAVATALLRELSLFALTSDMLRGLPSAYATLVGYDEVAHHSGVASRDALRVLGGIDKVLEWLERISQYGARPYRFVVLSDHGQSFGATFLQRAGKSLEELTRELADLRTVSVPGDDESWSRANSLLTELSRFQSPMGRISKRALRNNMRNGVVMLGPESREERSKAAPWDEEEVVVLASGNMGVIYFTAYRERMTLEQISWAFPKLIPGLLSYPQLGWILVRSERHGPVVIGAKGHRYLKTGRVVGEDPLQIFGSLASSLLMIEDSFSNAPDLLVNSFYDQENDEVAAFHELIGSHGGLGGQQSHGILVHPAELDAGSRPIVGSCRLHRVLKNWLPK